MARKRTWIGLLIAFLLVIAIFWGAMWMLNRLFSGASPALAVRNVLDVRLAGQIVERPSTFWGTEPVGALSVREIDRALRRAANDRRVDGMILRVGPLATGFGKAQEIRAAIHAFRDAGKPVVALLEIGSILDLYVASAADRIVQIPTGNMLLGLLSRTQYYRELLDTIGVQFESFHTGPYKSAMNPYTETGMSEEERQVINSLLDSIYGQLLDDIAADRGLSTQQVAAAIDHGVLPASAAREAGIIDELGFRDELEGFLGVTGAKRVSLRDYWEASGSSSLGWGRPVIAVVHVSGMIVPGETADGLFGGGGFAGGDSVARHLRAAHEDSDVRAIVLRVDSPGGAVTASDVIWRATMLAAEDKPVIVSMSDVAASGGYWIATAAHRVLADPATYTGSIGVVSGHVNLQQTYAKLGIGNELIKRGENADIFSDATPLTDAQRAVMQASIDDTYHEFIAKVASARGLALEEVERLAAGRVWTGAQALEVGLVDELGGLHEALQVARREAGIAADAAATVRIYPQPRSFFEQLGSVFSLATAGELPSARVPDADALDLLLSAEARAQQLRLARRLASAGHNWALLQAPVPAAAR